MLFIDLAADALFGFDWRPPAFSMAQNAMILGFSVWLAGRTLTVRHDVLTFGVAGARPVPTKPTPAADHSRNDALARRLIVLIESDRVHLDPALTFDRFVVRMSAPGANGSASIPRNPILHGWVEV